MNYGVYILSSFINAFGDYISWSKAFGELTRLRLVFSKSGQKYKKHGLPMDSGSVAYMETHVVRRS